MSTARVDEDYRKPQEGGVPLVGLSVDGDTLAGDSDTKFNASDVRELDLEMLEEIRDELRVITKYLALVVGRL